jgi:hypothetical protein
MLLQKYIRLGLNLCDYDLYQRQLTQQLMPQKNVHYLPYQITKQENQRLTTLVEQTPKRYQVCFCSTNKSKKRLTLYSQLEQRGLRVVDVSGWKEDRDCQIAEAQVLVNVHFDHDYQIFEHMRCDRWILAGLLVISETSLSDSLLDCRDLLITDTYDHLADTIVQVVANYDVYYAQYLERLNLHKAEIMETRLRACQQFFDKIK